MRRWMRTSCLMVSDSFSASQELCLRRVHSSSSMSQQAGKSHHQQLYVPFSLTLYSVDTQTDARMQEVIRTEFSDRTITMIAHRIDTLLDFDKVAVLDAGSLVEFGSPQELLRDEAGAFTRLYRANKGTKTDV